MESKCFYCFVDKVSLNVVVSYIVVGGKTFPVCASCDEIVASITPDDFETEFV